MDTKKQVMYVLLFLRIQYFKGLKNKIKLNIGII